MYTPAERLQHLDIPRRCTPVIPIVLGLGHAGRDGRYDLFHVKVEDLIVDFARGVGSRGDVQEGREGEGGDDGLR